MDRKTWFILVLLIPAVVSGWKSSPEDTRSSREVRRDSHYHSKRHMLSEQANVPEAQQRRRTTTSRREVRKKPSGHLTPLQDDEMDNDEVVSVAVGPPPPPIRPKYEKSTWKKQKQPNTTVSTRTKVDKSDSATNLVRDVLTQLGKEFLTRQVNEDFVFGQYVGNAMRNLTSELRLKMQHDILELIVRYQKINRGEIVETTTKPEDKNMLSVLKEIKVERKGNETEEGWPDFSNLAKIVG